MNVNLKKAVMAVYDFDLDVDVYKVPDAVIASLVTEVSEKDIERLDFLYERYYEVGELYQKFLKDSYTDPQMYHITWLRAYKDHVEQLEIAIRQHVEEIVKFDRDRFYEIMIELNGQTMREYLDYIAAAKERH